MASRDPGRIERFLKRRRIARRVVGVFLLLLLGTVVFGHARRAQVGGDDWARFDRKQFTVLAAASGDSFTISREPGEAPTTVRMIGIAGPEEVAGAAQPSFDSPHARAALGARLEGRQVLLRLAWMGNSAADGSVLAYAYLPGSTLSLNQQIITDGEAYADRRTAHTLHKQFEQAEGDARKKKRGLWAENRDDQQPPWRQAWLRQLKIEREAEPTE